MRKSFTGVAPFSPEGRFQGGRRQGQQQPPADPAAGGGLPSEPPAPPAGTPPAAPASGSVDLSKLFQNLQKLSIANEPTKPKVMTLAEALRKHFGDQAEIEAGDKTIKITTPQGARELEVYTRRSKGNTLAYLRLRVDKNTTRPIGQLLRYGDEYYIDANSLKKIDNTSQPQKPAQEEDKQQAAKNKNFKRKLPKSVLYSAGLLAAGGTVAGLSRFLGGGDDDDKDKKTGLQFVTVPLGGSDDEANPAENGRQGGESAPAGGEPKPADDKQKPAAGHPPVTVTERPAQSQAQPVVVQVPAPQVIREITSGEAPVQTQRKGNETVVKAGTSDGVFTLNIGADKTLILKGKEVVGEFPTSEIIRAVGQMADGKTEKEIRRSGEFDDLLKNPWFLVAIALALIAFTRRSGRE